MVAILLLIAFFAVFGVIPFWLVWRFSLRDETPELGRVASAALALAIVVAGFLLVRGLAKMRAQSRAAVLLAPKDTIDAAKHHYAIEGGGIRTNTPSFAELTPYLKGGGGLTSDRDARTPKYQWTKITERAPFAPRDGAGALVFKGRMWLLGGWNPSDPAHFPNHCNSEVWSSSDGRQWKLEKKAAPWEKRHTAGYVVFQDKMWIVGGDPIQGHFQKDVWNSSDGVKWTKVADDVPWGDRVLHHTLVFDNKIWVIGGQRLDDDVFYSDVWNSPDGVKWTKVADRLPWGPRGLIGGNAVFKGRIWLLGGGTYETPKIPQRKFYNDVWSSADGVHWEQNTKAAPWPGREYHDVAVFDGRMWVMEGYREPDGNLKDVWHSEDGVNWTEVPNTPWPERHAASVFVHDNALWMVAGNNMTPDVWKLTRVK